MLKIRASQFIDSEPAPDPDHRAFAIVGLARAQVEYTIPVNIKSAGRYVFSIFIRPQAKSSLSVPISVLIGDKSSKEEDTIVLNNSWTQRYVFSECSVGLTEATVRLGNEEIPARPTDKLLIWCPNFVAGAILPSPIVQNSLPPQPFVIIEDIIQAARLRQLVDDASGLPRIDRRGRLVLTDAILLSHPTRELFAVAVTPKLIEMSIRREIQIPVPTILGSDWDGALPVPLAATNRLTPQEYEYREAFGISVGQSESNSHAIELVEAQMRDLELSLSKRPEDLHKLDPRRFEELIADLLERDGSRVNLTRSSKDGGIDIHAINVPRLGRFLLGVQCKRNAPHRKIEVNVLRELVGALVLSEQKSGLVVTTSSFTHGSIQLAKSYEQQDFDLDLVDFDDLRRWLLDYYPP